MKKLNKYQLAKISKNLDYYFDSATVDDMKQGLKWYDEAHEICKDIAQKYNSNTLTVAQVMSALSPRNKWQQNIKDTKKVFQAIKEGLEPEDIKVCTFHTNKFKAFNIVKSDKEKLAAVKAVVLKAADLDMFLVFRLISLLAPCIWLNILTNSSLGTIPLLSDIS